MNPSIGIDIGSDMTDNQFYDWCITNDANFDTEHSTFYRWLYEYDKVIFSSFRKIETSRNYGRFFCLNTTLIGSGLTKRHMEYIKDNKDFLTMMEI